MTASTLDDLAIPQDERERRLARVLGRARTPVKFMVTESTLFALGGALAVAGVVLILLGWLGTSRTVLVAGQIPYLVSGGLLGLGLIFLGGFLYFGYWLATLVRDGRTSAEEQHVIFREMRDELAALHRTLAQTATTATVAAAVATGGLVRTRAGSMVHRADCPVVAGKDGLVAASASDGKPCAICQPEH